MTGALTAVLLFCALRWEATRRRRDLYLLIAVFALSLGNHLTVAAVAPAVIVFVVLTDRRTIQWRNTAIAVLVVIAGLAQYGSFFFAPGSTHPISRRGPRICGNSSR